jgi:hypothetical protein
VKTHKNVFGFYGIKPEHTGIEIRPKASPSEITMRDPRPTSRLDPPEALTINKPDSAQDDRLAAVLKSVNSPGPRIAIPQDRIPPEYRNNLPPELQPQLAGLDNKEAIIAAIWSFYADDINRQNRETIERTAHPPPPPSARGVKVSDLFKFKDLNATPKVPKE